MGRFVDGTIDGVTVRALRMHTDRRGWLAELYRADEATPETIPAMCYVSLTRPGEARGPHEHRWQSDWCCFVGPSDFALLLWDNRPQSPTCRHRMRVVVGESNPSVVIIPPGVVHGYRNVGPRDGLVWNLPSRLYRGPGRGELPDETRHEQDPNSPFRLDDDEG